jgi:hypothetical protein
VEEMVVFLHRYSMQIFQTGHLLPQRLPQSRQEEGGGDGRLPAQVQYPDFFKMVTYFLNDFLHPNREKVEEMVVFLHRYADYFNMVTSLFKNFLRPGKEKIAEMVIFL